MNRQSHDGAPTLKVGALSAPNLSDFDSSEHEKARISEAAGTTDAQTLCLSCEVPPVREKTSIRRAREVARGSKSAVALCEMRGSE